MIKYIGAVLALAIVLGSILALTFSSAEGAVAMNRFSVTCIKQGVQGFDKTYFRKQADPFVAFGQPVSAHPHDAIGYVNWGPSSLTAAAEKAASDARGHPEDGGYAPLYSNCPNYGHWPLWLEPVASMNGQALTPTTFTVTYQAPIGTPVIKPPFGETFIAGDSHATATSTHIRYTCGDGNGTPGSSIDGPGSDKPIDCTNVPGGVVTAEVTWPDCWDGQGSITETPMGISPGHFYYSTNGACPPGTVPCVQGKLMAQEVTQSTWLDPADPTKQLRNPLNPDGSVALTFSSGSYATFHMDYQNLNNHYEGDWIETCLNHGTPGSCPYGTRIGLHNLQ